MRALLLAVLASCVADDVGAPRVRPMGLVHSCVVEQSCGSGPDAFRSYTVEACGVNHYRAAYVAEGECGRDPRCADGQYGFCRASCTEESPEVACPLTGER